MRKICIFKLCPICGGIKIGNNGSCRKTGELYDPDSVTECELLELVELKYCVPIDDSSGDHESSFLGRQDEEFQFGDKTKIPYD